MTGRILRAFLVPLTQCERPSFTAIQNITAVNKFCNLETATTRPGHLNLISSKETELLVFFSHQQVTYTKSKFGLFYGRTRDIEINRACPKRFISPPTPTPTPWQNGGYNRQRHSHCIIYLVARIYRRINQCTSTVSRSQWPRSLRRRSGAARLLRLWVRKPPGHGYLSVVSVVCVVR